MTNQSSSNGNGSQDIATVEAAGNAMRKFGLSNAQFAARASVSPGAFSQWMSGKYPGNTAEIGRKVARAIRTLEEGETVASNIVRAPELVETDATRAILDALRRAQIARVMAEIYGPPGTGKTSACVYYASTNAPVWHATMRPSSKRVASCLEMIRVAIGIEPVWGMLALSRAIEARLADSGGLLIIDEAQHLQTDALEEIRSLHDKARIGIAFAGSEQLRHNLHGQRNKRNMSQLTSRVAAPVMLDLPSEDEVKTILSIGWGITDSKVTKFCVSIARRPGAIRQLTNVLITAQTAANSASRAVVLDDVRGAWMMHGGAQ